MEALTVLVTYTVRPGTGRAFLRQVVQRGLLDQIRREDGCQRYDYYLPADGADHVLLVEQWASAGQQAVHIKQPHMKELFALQKEYVLHTQADFLTPREEH